MKKSDDNEHHALRALMSDTLRPFVPEFKRVVERDGDSILPIQITLSHYLGLIVFCCMCTVAVFRMCQ